MSSPFLSRRRLLASTAGLTIPLPAIGNDRESTPQRAIRPEPPYRVWFQPRLFHRDIDLYRHMTIDASGWLDPRLAEAFGVTALNWVYGVNHPSAGGSQYWRDAASAGARSFPKETPKLIAAGIAIDEWVPPAHPENTEWLTTGLRDARTRDPEVFIAVWSTDPTPPLFEIVRDGTVDLVIVEGYTHSVEAGLSTSWDGGLRRMNAFADAGLIDRTIFSFGHITDRVSHRGEYLRSSWLREKAGEIKERFPSSPGIAFFQSTDEDTPDLRALVRDCDRLSSALWPD